MYSIEVYNFATCRSFGIQMFKDKPLESMSEVNECLKYYVAKGCWGKPLRKLNEDSLSEFEKTRVMSKDKDESDKWVCQVKADYEIRIYKNSTYKQKRAEHYPSYAEVSEALMENMEMRPQKLEQIKAIRAAVKAKYPKDEKELLEIR